MTELIDAAGAGGASLAEVELLPQEIRDRLSDEVIDELLAGARSEEVECPRFRGRVSAWSARSDRAGRIVHHAKGIELPEAVSAGVSA